MDLRDCVSKLQAQGVLVESEIDTSGGELSWILLLKTVAKKGSAAQTREVFEAYLRSFGGKGGAQFDDAVAATLGRLCSGADADVAAAQRLLQELLRARTGVKAHALNVVLTGMQLAAKNASRGQNWARNAQQLLGFVRDERALARLVGAPVPNPNEESFAIVMDLCSTQAPKDAFRSAKQLFEQCLEVQRRPNSAVFTSLLRAAFTSDEQKAIDEVEELLRKYQVLITANMQSKLLQGIVTSGRRRDRVTRRTAEIAESLLRWLAQHAGDIIESPSKTAYNAVLEAWGDSGAFNACEKIEALINFMTDTQSELGPSDVNWEHAIHACRTSEADPAKAEAVIGFLGGQSMPISNQMWQDLLACYKTASLKLKDDKRTYGDSAETALSHMAQAGFTPRREDVLAAIECRIPEKSADSLKRAVSLLQEIHQMYGRNGKEERACVGAIGDALVRIVAESTDTESNTAKDCLRTLVTQCVLGPDFFSRSDWGEEAQERGEDAAFSVRVLSDGDTLEEAKQVLSAALAANLTACFAIDACSAITMAELRVAGERQNPLSAFALVLQLIEAFSALGLGNSERNQEILTPKALERLLQSARDYHSVGDAGKLEDALYAVSTKCLDVASCRPLRELGAQVAQTLMHLLQLQTGPVIAQKVEEARSRFAPLLRPGKSVQRQSSQLAQQNEGIVQNWVSSGADDAPEQAERALKEILARGEPVSERAYSAVIKAWESSKRSEGPQQIRSILEMMRIQPPSPNPNPHIVTLSTAMRCWARSGRHDAAEFVEKLLQEAIRLHPDQLDEFLFTYALNAWAKHPERNPDGNDRRWQRAMTIFQLMQSHGVEITEISMNALLRACLSVPTSAAVEEGLKLLMGMQNHGVTPDAGSFGTLIHAQAAISSPETAAKCDELLQKCVSGGVIPDAVTVHTVIKAWSFKGGSTQVSERCEHWLDYMLLHNLKPLATTWNIVINAFANSQTPSSASKCEELALRMFAECNIRANEVTWSTVVKAWDKAHRNGDASAPARAEVCLQHLTQYLLSDDYKRHAGSDLRARERLVVPYSMVIRMWAHSKDPGAADHAERILGMIQQATLRPSSRTWNAVIDVWANMENRDDAAGRAAEVLRQMKASGLEPDSSSYDNVLKAFARSPNPNPTLLGDAVEIFREMTTTGSTAPTCFIVSEMFKITWRALNRREQRDRRQQFASHILEALKNCIEKQNLRSIDGRGWEPMRKNLTRLMGSDEVADEMLKEAGVTDIVTQAGDSGNSMRRKRAGESGPIQGGSKRHVGAG